MGFNLGWIATTGKTKADILGVLNLAETGISDPFVQAENAAADISGWYVVIDGPARLVDNSPMLKALSAGAGVLSVAMLEGSMLSYAAEWLDGRMMWSVMHDSSARAPNGLDVVGAPPSDFAAIRNKYIARQGTERGVDFIFEIPLELARTIVPFRPDEMPIAFGPKFQRLRRI